MMKKYSRKILLILSVVALIPSCEMLNCKDCSYVTYEDGVYVSETPSIPYCNDALANKEAEDPVTVGNRTTQVECY